jgi:hypothetical protein
MLGFSFVAWMYSRVCVLFAELTRTEILEQRLGFCGLVDFDSRNAKFFPF